MKDLISDKYDDQLRNISELYEKGKEKDLFQRFEVIQDLRDIAATQLQELTKKDNILEEFLTGYNLMRNYQVECMFAAIEEDDVEKRQGIYKRTQTSVERMDRKAIELLKELSGPTAGETGDRLPQNKQ